MKTIGVFLVLLMLTVVGLFGVMSHDCGVFSESASVSISSHSDANCHSTDMPTEASHCQNYCFCDIGLSSFESIRYSDIVFGSIHPAFATVSVSVAGQPKHLSYVLDHPPNLI